MGTTCCLEIRESYYESLAEHQKNHSKRRQKYIYVFECVSGKYYIGCTTNPKRRRIEHERGVACAWTTEHLVKNLIYLEKQSSEHDEDNLTLEYMQKYGIDNVRGGTWSQIELPEYTRKTIQDILVHRMNQCFHCHQYGHYANKCPDRNGKRPHFSRR
jgi:predicted GIY-YIG superfamily endonuclease